MVGDHDLGGGVAEGEAACRSGRRLRGGRRSRRAGVRRRPPYSAIASSHRRARSARPGGRARRRPPRTRTAAAGTAARPGRSRSGRASARRAGRAGSAGPHLGQRRPRSASRSPPTTQSSFAEVAQQGGDPPAPASRGSPAGGGRHVSDAAARAGPSSPPRRSAERRAGERAGRDRQGGAARVGGRLPLQRPRSRPSAWVAIGTSRQRRHHVARIGIGVEAGEVLGEVVAGDAACGARRRPGRSAQREPCRRRARTAPSARPPSARPRRVIAASPPGRAGRCRAGRRRSRSVPSPGSRPRPPRSTLDWNGTAPNVIRPNAGGQRRRCRSCTSITPGCSTNARITCEYSTSPPSRSSPMSPPAAR